MGPTAKHQKRMGNPVHLWQPFAAKHLIMNKQNTIGLNHSVCNIDFIIVL